jgi:hypothetical protein
MFPTHLPRDGKAIQQKHCLEDINYHCAGRRKDCHFLKLERFSQLHDSSVRTLSFINQGTRRTDRAIIDIPAQTTLSDDPK